MKCLLPFLLLLLPGCATSYYSVYASLPPHKQRFFIPFHPDSSSTSVPFAADSFYVQELTAENVRLLARQHRYTLVLLWAPWCPGPETQQIAQQLLNYEQQLQPMDFKVVFVAVAYGPDGIRKMVQELNYRRPTYVVRQETGTDNVRQFRQRLNSRRKYRNAVFYVFKEGQLVYTGKDAEKEPGVLQEVVK